MAKTDEIAHVSIEMPESNRMVTSSIKEKLCHVSPSFLKSSIFRVPQKLRQRNENVYDPNIVSIGPFHNGTKTLAPMEKMKMWYLGSLLQRFTVPPPEEALEHIVESIRSLQRSARECYADPFNLEDETFIEMLRLFELSELTVSVDEREPDFLVKLVLKFFETMMLMTVPAEYRPNGRGIKHILHLLCSCLLSNSCNRRPENTRLELFPPVTGLLQSGVKFKKGTPDDILNIKFRKGEIEIPPIKIQGNSESLFQNLIAYEQCDRHCMDQFTSYGVFLDCLINSSKDADVLCDEEIVVQALSTEDISLLFNRLYNDTLISEFYYGGIGHDINEYYRSRWPRWRATLKRDYFNNPWSFSSFIAAILVLIFTFAQTLFTILPYVYPLCK
uniref:Uncharacterized protein n=1 Tax=Fagus sylvatica TaxID=28930 RepID=A0A2N9H0G5_FAGSY